MKKHPFANQLRLRYWYLYRDIQTKSEQLKLKKALSSYLRVLETRDLVDKLCNHGGLYSLFLSVFITSIVNVKFN